MNRTSCEFQELRTERWKKKRKPPKTMASRLVVRIEPQAFSLPSLLISWAPSGDAWSVVLAWKSARIFGHFSPIHLDFRPNLHRNSLNDPNANWPANDRCFWVLIKKFSCSHASRSGLDDRSRPVLQVWQKWEVYIEVVQNARKSSFYCDFRVRLKHLTTIFQM